MLAMPLGIRSQRSSSGAGFGISILIVFGFYVVTTVCLAVGRTNPNLAPRSWRGFRTCSSWAPGSGCSRALRKCDRVTLPLGLLAVDLGGDRHDSR